MGSRFNGDGSGLDLAVYTDDANYAEKADNRRSVPGNSVVSWVSSTQLDGHISTSEAEYVALGDGEK